MAFISTNQNTYIYCFLQTSLFLLHAITFLFVKYRFSYIVIAKAKPHKITKPLVIGNNVPLYNCPIIEARIKDYTEDDAPIIAEAIPATCPIGSIAIAFKLPNKVPNNKNRMHAYNINIQKEI